MLAADWAVDVVVKVVDGDSVHLMMSTSPQLVTEDLAQSFSTARPWKCRLVTLDTPERGEVGWAEARNDVASWLAEYADDLRAQTYQRDNFGRVLTDIYVAGDRGNTLSQAMLKAGWNPYVA